MIVLAGAANAQPTVTELLEQKTLAEIRRFAAGFEGVLGVSAIDLTSGRSFAFQGDTVFPTASTIKIPILFRVYQAERAGRLHHDGDTVDFEAGYSRHLDWHRQPKDTRTWYGWARE